MILNNKKDNYEPHLNYLLDNPLKLINKKDSSIKVTNIGGPLNHLENTWYFNDHDNGTEISFDIDFEIENKFLNVVMTKSFQFGLNKIADAFQKRAETLYK